MLAIVRNSLIAVIASLIFLSLPLVFPATDETVRNVVLAVTITFVWTVLLTGVYAFFAGKPALFWTAWLTMALMAVVLVFAIKLDAGLYYGFVGVVAGAAALFTWLHVTREVRAVKRAERRSAREAEQKEQAQLDGIATALTDVPSVWLLDALGVPEKTSGRNLIATVADLPEGTAYALLRAYRKNLKADDVTPLIAAGSFTEADADRLAKEANS